MHKRDERRLAGGAIVAAAAALLLGSGCRTTSDQRPSALAGPREGARSYRHAGRFWYIFDNVRHGTDKDRRAPVIRLWAALPLERPGQHVEIGAISPEPREIIVDPQSGNRVVYWKIERPAGERAAAARACRRALAIGADHNGSLATARKLIAKPYSTSASTALKP